MDTPVISADVLARYAGDAAREVDGVAGLTRGAAEVAITAERADVVVHVELVWGAAAKDACGRVQERVAEYLGRMANLEVGSVDVIVERVGAPPAKQ
jgi:uncharacterized alkaline shock family protein YloU